MSQSQEAHLSHAIEAAAEDETPKAKAQLQSVPVTTQIGALTLSREFEEIVKALGEVQTAVNTDGLVAEAKNDVLHNMYAKLPAILKALTPHLKAHGITLLQPYEAHESTVRVTTIFMKGKQFVSMIASMTAETPYPHAIGSAVTYCCRYSIRAMLGLAVDDPGYTDDDGNSASGVSSGSKQPQSTGKSTPSKEASPKQDGIKDGASQPAGYSEALRGYLKRVDTADLAGLSSAESQVSAFKLSKSEEEILVKAIRERKEKLAASSETGGDSTS